MGFNNADLKLLLSGIEGQSICTLGRLNLFLSQHELSKILSEFGRPSISLPMKATLFAEDALVPLGYTVESMDASAYEQASIIHDLNRPISNDLIERFDIVWDGGTLEHIFNFPIGLSNAMRMVKTGGHLALRTPANNHCGHGFYQFSPELFFRVLTPSNGFELVRMYVSSRGRQYHVKDPAASGERVELLDSVPAMLMVHARKIGPTPAEITIPQQSDYVATWSKQRGPDGRLKSFLRRRLSSELIEKISGHLNRLRQQRAVRRWKRKSRLSNRDIYRPVEQWRSPTARIWRDS